MARRVVTTPKPDISQPVDMVMLGAVIRHRRTSVSMTLEDASALCGISKQAYNNIELGAESVKVETLFKVLRAFGISLSVCDLPTMNTESDLSGDYNEWL